MAIAVNSTRLGSLVDSGTSPYFVTLTSTPTFGSTLLLSMAASGNTSVITEVYDKYGNTWVQVFDSGSHSPTAVRVYLWVCKSHHSLVSGDIITIKATASGIACALDEATGLGTQHSPDVTVTAFDSTAVSAFSTGASAATSYNDELVWAVIGTPLTSGITQTITAGTGYTQQGVRVAHSVQNVGMYTEYKIISATGAQTADGTINTTASKYACGLATFAAPQSPESTYRATSLAQTEVSVAVGVNRGASFIAAEVAAAIGVQRGVSYVGVEVAGSVTPYVPPSTSRRPMPIVAG